MSLRLRLALTILVSSVALVYGVFWLRAELEQRELEARIEQWVDVVMEAGQGVELADKSPETWGGSISSGRGGGGGRSFGRGRRRPWMFNFTAARVVSRVPLRPAEIWVYGSDLASKNAGAPAFPAELAAQLTGEQRTASRITGRISAEERARMERERRERWERNRRARSQERERRAGSNNDSQTGSRSFRDRGPRGDRGRGERRQFLADPNEGPTDRVECAVRLDSGNPAVAYILLKGLWRRRPDGFWWMPIVVSAGLLLAVLLSAAPLVGRIRVLTDEVRRSAAGHYREPVSVRGSDEISRLAIAFNEAGGEIHNHLEQLREREQALRQFVNNTTHDVMIPLTVLKGHLSTLRTAIESGKSVDAGLLTSSLDEAHYLAAILHNLSAVAKLEGIEVGRDAVDLGKLVDRAVARHLPLAGTHSVAVEFSVPEEPVEVTGDVTLIEQALSNVILNAVRYNHPGGHVAVLLERPNENGRFSLRVIDDGPGVPDDELAQLADRRFRGNDARTRHPHGLGLGLNIAHDVADRHGFELEMRHSEYGGLEVELSGATREADAD